AVGVTCTGPGPRNQRYLVKVFDTRTGQERRCLGGAHLNVIRDVAFSPDGTSLASASDDATIHLWHWRSGRVLRTLKGEARRLDDRDPILGKCERNEDCRFTGLAFSPDGRLLVSAGADQALRIWDMRCGGEVPSLLQHDDAVPARASPTAGLEGGAG